MKHLISKTTKHPYVALPALKVYFRAGATRNTHLVEHLVGLSVNRLITESSSPRSWAHKLLFLVLYQDGFVHRTLSAESHGYVKESLTALARSYMNLRLDPFLCPLANALLQYTQASVKRQSVIDVSIVAKFYNDIRNSEPAPSSTS